MSLTIRLSGPDDRAPILSLMAEARGDNLTAAQRAERGFVQGTMDDSVLARFQDGTGVFIAEEGGVLAGFAMTSAPGSMHAGPPKLTADVATAAHPDSTLFLYGPVAVSAKFQGRGVMTKLLVALCAALQDRFDRGAAFVEVANKKSLAVHRHYGMHETGAFTFDDRDYVVFTFEPAVLAAH
ncbi:GNAT family N-acetyltransferase [Antrihabitans cavernicola]|nr:GNAT family N-acetyltransferase [Spelaeibacter cavernicola]